MMVLAMAASGTRVRAADDPQARRPNVLLIMADDLGFSDLGCYGGEIPTPRLDALAQNGLRYTQFYNTARCWPSRAAVLTGFYAQQVRRDTVPGVPSGNAGTRPVWAKLLPERLQALGYRSYHSGKWHLDGKPLATGFDRSYRLDDHDRYFAPRLHFEDDIALRPVSTNSEYYATSAIADHALRCLKDHSKRFAGQPFFSFVAFTAPHFPVQAPATDIARHQDRYLGGWDLLREDRWRRIRQHGLIPGELPPIEREIGPPYAFPDALKALGPDELNRPSPWSELSDRQRRFQADKMAIHAAMVDRMDQEIGRLVDQLRSMGQLDDTLILFVSDNGASAEMMVRGDGHDRDALCGTGATFLSIGPGWSSLANTPFRRHKTWVHEGGISTPLIAHWPRGISDRGALRRTPGHLVDLVPTILEMTGNPWPGPSPSPDMPTPPGRSLVPTFTRDSDLHREALWWQHEGNRALRLGDWKIVAAGTKAPWELYHLAEDRTETRDLASRHPERVREMALRWEAMTASHAATARAGATARSSTRTPFGAWKHSGSVFVLTTPDGASLQAGVTLEGFPLLVRLDGEWFDFSQARPRGEDLRISTPEGEALPFEIESWDPKSGSAAIWVRMPRIQGNARQELRLHWGHPEAGPVSKGTEVFGRANGYLGTWHLGDTIRDASGTLTSEDRGTSAETGMIGTARRFREGRGIFGGNTLDRYPAGSAPHTSQAWFLADQLHGRILAWGNEQPQGKVVLHYTSPPQVRLDCYFSGANVNTRKPVSTGQWHQVVHTWEPGDSKVYIDGVLEGTSKGRQAPLNLRQPARLWIGGWYDHFDFQGLIDEVRVSDRVRSAEWIRFEFENQRTLQTAVGPLVSPGREFGVSIQTPQGQARVQEGQALEFVAKAGGAQRVWWSLRDADGRTSVVAVNRFRHTFTAGRISGDQTVMLTFHAAYPEGVRRQEIPITLLEAIGDPEFTLATPKTWNGRDPLWLKPVIRSGNAGNGEAKALPLNVSWSVEPFATIREIHDQDLLLTRALHEGPLTVTATLDNGGKPVRRSVTLSVDLPNRDAWVRRVPEPSELPQDNQFYARDDRNRGTLFATGKLQDPAESVKVRLFAGDRLQREQTARLKADRSFRFEWPLKPGLIRYRFELIAIHQGVERRLHSATNLVCGDAYLIDGQSNAVATDWGEGQPEYRSDWIRSFGSMGHESAGNGTWGNAVHRGRNDERHQVGYWAMELGRHLVETHRIPVCFLNGAVGGTRIDQHQRNPTHPTDPATIYGRLLARARAARLTHGIRAVIWHQGENDQGADGPGGGYGWENYRQLFIDLAAAWATDYPNARHHYAFQIWPKSCAMGVDGSDNRLREVQRNLPSAVRHLTVMSTLGIQPPGECHYPARGYAEMARLIAPLIDRDLHGVKVQRSITAPNLIRAGFGNADASELLLEFDQPVVWDASLATEFWLDGKRAPIASGATEGHRLILTLREPSKARTLTYLDSASWSPKRVLRGAHGIAALTFCDVPLDPALQRYQRARLLRK
jgi:arylsulfatase A-like enzyme